MGSPVGNIKDALLVDFLLKQTQSQVGLEGLAFIDLDSTDSMTITEWIQLHYHKYEDQLHQLQYDCLVCVGNDANGHCLRSFAMIGRRCLLVVKGQ